MKYYQIEIKLNQNRVASRFMPDFEMRRFLADYILGNINLGKTESLMVKVTEVDGNNKTIRQMFEEKLFNKGI